MKTLLLAIATLSSLFIAVPQAEARDRHSRDNHRHYVSRGHYYRPAPRVYYSHPRYYYPTERIYYYDDYGYPVYHPRYHRSGLGISLHF